MPVGQTAPGALQRLRLLLREPGPQLADEPGLADACVTDDHDQLRPALGDASPVRLLQLPELRVPADEHRTQPPDAARPHERERADEPLRRHSLRLPLGLDGHRLGELERATNCRCRPLADEDLARPRGLLEPRADVHGIARDEGGPFPGAADHHLAGVDPDPQAKTLAEQFTQPPLHAERRVQSPLRVVLERSRSAERRQHGVAHELFHRAARLLDLLRHRVVEAVEQGSSPLRILLGSEGRRSHEVGKENGRHLPFFSGLRAALHGRRAARAEACVGRKLGTALCAGGHAHIVARHRVRVTPPRRQRAPASPARERRRPAPFAGGSPATGPPGRPASDSRTPRVGAAPAARSRGRTRRGTRPAGRAQPTRAGRRSGCSPRGRGGSADGGSQPEHARSRQRTGSGSTAGLRTFYALVVAVATRSLRPLGSPEKEERWD